MCAWFFHCLFTTLEKKGACEEVEEQRLGCPLGVVRRIWHGDCSLPSAKDDVSYNTDDDYCEYSATNYIGVGGVVDENKCEIYILATGRSIGCGSAEICINWPCFSFFVRGT